MVKETDSKSWIKPVKQLNKMIKEHDSSWIKPTKQLNEMIKEPDYNSWITGTRELESLQLERPKLNQISKFQSTKFPHWAHL